jgi:TonB family protein
MHQDVQDRRYGPFCGPESPWVRLRPLGWGFLSLLLVAGCASAGGAGPGGGGDEGPRAELLSPWHPPSGQVCVVVSSPEVLPTPDALLDRRALAHTLDRAFSGDVPRGRALLSLRQDSTGTWTRVAPIEGSHPAPTLDRLAALVEPLLSGDPVGNVRLLVETGADPGTGAGPDPGPDTGLRLTVGRQEMCSPEIANRSFVAAELEQIWQQFRVEAHLLVRVEVDTEGRVAGAELIEPSGHAAIDAAVSRLLLRIQFHPALNDRIPVATFNQFPLSIRAGR